MNILFVSSYDVKRNTSSNIRTIALIQALATAGHSVSLAYFPSGHESDPLLGSCIDSSCSSVISLKKTKPKTEVYPLGNNNVMPKGNLSIGNIKKYILRLYDRFFIYDVFQMEFRRIDNEKISKLERFYDIIVSSSEPRSSHKLVKLLRKNGISCKKWVQYWGDPITNDVASKKILPFREKIVEENLITQGNISLYTNPGCVEYMKSKYASQAKKMFWIPTSDIKTVVEYSNMESRLIAYVGDYKSIYRNIKPFYLVCKKLLLQTTIAGGSDVSLEPTDSISILGRVSKTQADVIESQSKILVVLDNERVGKECIQVPGKMYHYALTDKYILVISNSNSLENYYGCYNRYVFVRNTEEEIENGIKKILSGVFPESYKTPVSDFQQSKIVDVFLKIIDKEE